MEELHIFKKRVERKLIQFFDEKEKKARKIDKLSSEIVLLVKEFTLRGGKRIRSALTYYGYRCFSSTKQEEIIKASMAFELLQSFLLIHDDIMDNDDTRRNGPSLHKSCESLLRKKFKKNLKHTGTSLAIIAGDICYAFANEILSSLKLKESRKNQAIKYLNHIVHKVCYGQSLDVLSNFRKNFKESDAKKINILKTSTYTFAGPLILGGILAGTGKKELKKLESISIPLGEAFQIQDDIIGLFGTEKEIGKPIGSDIREGKKTLLILDAIANTKDKFLEKKLGKKVTKKELEIIKKKVEESGSIKKYKIEIHNKISEAKNIIIKSKFRREGKNFLLNFCKIMEKRKY